MRTIKISQYQFPISEPFVAGQTLGEAEATALNALRAENIRNLLAHKVRAAIEAVDGRLLSEAELAPLRQIAGELDRNYRFGVRRSVPREGAIEREARIIAQGLLGGLDQGEEGMTPAERQEQLERLMKTERVQGEARKRLEDQARIAQAALRELL